MDRGGLKSSPFFDSKTNYIRMLHGEVEIIGKMSGKKEGVYLFSDSILMKCYNHFKHIFYSIYT